MCRARGATTEVGKDPECQDRWTEQVRVQAHEGLELGSGGTQVGPDLRTNPWPLWVDCFWQPEPAAAGPGWGLSAGGRA